MDQFGIEKQVVYPSVWLGCLAEDVELEAALARSYNQFMATQRPVRWPALLCGGLALPESSSCG